jgi:hypothetical protein
VSALLTLRLVCQSIAAERTDAVSTTWRSPEGAIELTLHGGWTGADRDKALKYGSTERYIADAFYQTYAGG